MSVLGNCQKCQRVIQLPSLDGIEEAADRLNRDELGSRGAAIAYLLMVANCMRGICVTCQPVDGPLHSQRQSSKYEPAPEVAS